MRLTCKYLLRSLVALAACLAACGDDGGAIQDDPDADVVIDAAIDAPLDPDADPPPPMVEVSVAVAGAGSGIVYSDPVGINCPGTCSESSPSVSAFCPAASFVIRGFILQEY